ncbi:hypothetical protein [Aureimonas phyllosphaerae]|uniref:Uncharacterized protein n=1 Tax=Aureimonas phyllosphaerae TaxID=1166078 RepID=A0A7W6BX86_9HYPH|nr:hypothetical protein [Aureimonas phyllosphaerae]MBB3938060.1 hypothetical protein [Aureimonas phyllosphaerae]MBB3962064.1 hypothetical protein [Aureimonas phyllosphaerae]SFF55133.1 hypothetical protein SAMN05216566_12622 [Aureimonas phyllosphaerae]
MSRIDPQLTQRGFAAERSFRDWLDASVVPHLYVEQSPVTVPAPLRGQIKRPDYLVGLPGVGLVAFDVKSKELFNGTFLFDLDEVRRLETFARLFHLTVIFACLPPYGGDRAYWVRLADLLALPVEKRGLTPVVALPLAQAVPVDLTQPFHAALVQLIALA